ncbi:MAG: symmetrical bis(5'-nucleosyl)-tetraphosphatase [Planctomycetota bacterium]|nr:MAG: symmetrical bis(5'-nucleosyl)-tetraphosphatase [Planctomycetota bacterium]
MATWAIGDVQGCYRTLLRLVERIGFDPARDRLWLVGDLVNRGPASLEVLRWARGLGSALVAVLGNHDLHLLAVDAGVRSARRKDTLDAVLAASDRADLLEWLRARPFVHREGKHLLVHAGLLPAWSCAEALRLADEASAWLRGADGRGFLERLFAPLPARWDPGLPREERLCFAANALTTIRAVTADGLEPDREFKAPPSELPPDRLPWFAHPARRCTELTIVFGHWAALGLHRSPGLLGLDTGCVWGGTLTACCLEDGRLVCEPRSEEGEPLPALRPPSRTPGE